MTGNVRALRPRIYHMAHKIAPNGSVSALCFAKPRSINLAKESWVLQDGRVTCPRCLKILANSSPASSDAASPGGAG